MTSPSRVQIVVSDIHCSYSFAYGAPLSCPVISVTGHIDICAPRLRRTNVFPSGIYRSPNRVVPLSIHTCPNHFRHLKISALTSQSILERPQCAPSSSAPPFKSLRFLMSTVAPGKNLKPFSILIFVCVFFQAFSTYSMSSANRASTDFRVSVHFSIKGLCEHVSLTI